MAIDADLVRHIPVLIAYSLKTRFYQQKPQGLLMAGICKSQGEADKKRGEKKLKKQSPNDCMRPYIVALGARHYYILCC